MLTSSFDILGNLDTGVINLRLFNLFQVLIVLSGTFLAVRNQPAEVFPAACWTIGVLTVLSLLNFASGVVSPYANMRTNAYAGWLAISAVTVIAGYAIGARAIGLFNMATIYMWSFLIMAIVGLMQLLAGLVGISLLTAQWWIPGRLPRLNGFCYEPSYYATYMIIGFGFAAEHWRNKTPYLLRLAKITSAICASVIILSSSRIGIACLVGYLCFRGISLAVSGRIFHASPLWGLSGWAAVIICTIAILFGAHAPVGISSMFLEGTGVGNTDAYSVLDRANGFWGDFRAWQASPYLGVGLGNVGIASADAMHLLRSLSLDSTRVFTGMNITLEILAGTGVTGLLLFIAFIFGMFWQLSVALKSRLLPRRMISPYIISFILPIIMLQFNQNILRAYLWMHLFVVASAIGSIYAMHPAQTSVRIKPFTRGGRPTQTVRAPESQWGL